VERCDDLDVRVVLVPHRGVDIQKHRLGEVRAFVWPIWARSSGFGEEEVEGVGRARPH
jgi:hypothetical protein